MIFNPRYNSFEWASAEHHYSVIRLHPDHGKELARYFLGFLPIGLCWVGEDLWLADAAAAIHRCRLDYG